MSSSHLPSPQYNYCHPLLRARDWQDRPELDLVSRWWEGGGAGVCALIGIGGAGKTALADRLLQSFPAALAQRSLQAHTRLRSPSRMFVFSFYEVPNADEVFFSLGHWIRGFVDSGFGSVPAGAKKQTLAYHQILDYLGWAPRADASSTHESSWLFVLDGLEKLQEDGARSTVVGSLTDRRLIDLLERTADGYLPNVGFLITTRFPIAQLEENRCTYYRPVAVEEISLDAAMRLLR